MWLLLVFTMPVFCVDFAFVCAAACMLVLSPICDCSFKKKKKEETEMCGEGRKKEQEGDEGKTYIQAERSVLSSTCLAACSAPSL